ncbi:MAG: CBS domain-containing protein [Gemmatimonadota bacterium]|nr:CBS domain-containing protein [Gemmatimonadota bacterium]
MRISDVLRSKGSDVVSVGPDCTVLEVVRTLIEHNIGATVVVGGGQLVGILSERDILRLVAGDPEALADTPTWTVMTRSVVTTHPDANLDEVMHLMTDHKVRHLPVVARGRLAGIVSIGDVVHNLRSETEATNRHLMAYISGKG